jgi:hypothetical protein
MTVTTRTRTINFGDVKGSLWPPGASSTPIVSTYSRSGRQTTISEGHQFSLLGESSRDIGGGFVSTKHEYGGGGMDLFLNRPTVPTGYRYRGVQSINANFNASDFPDPVFTSDSQLDGLGATAIARVEPTNPCFAAATFLGELRAGVPNIVGSGLMKQKVKRYRELGGEYLNVQFGWQPFKSDMIKARDAITKSHQILAQYERDSGKNIRRRYEFPVSASDPVTTDRGTAYPSPLLPSVLYLSGHGPGKLQYTDVTTKRQWFSGCFTYHLNMGTSSRDRMIRAYQNAQKLYGVAITPEVLWNITPWSWMADWFGNTGDILHNISAQAFNGLVIRYGYMMEESITTRTWELSDVWYLSRPYSHTFTQTFRTIRKFRRPATPYGFGLNWDGFSLYQLSILAALGISKAP